MSDRIEKADGKLLEEDIYEIYARIFGGTFPKDYKTVPLLLEDLIIRINRYFGRRAYTGDKAAFSALFHIATSAVRDYENILENHPETYERHAINHETIPVLVGRSPETIAKATSFVALTGAGDRIGLTGKGKHKESDFREIAEELIREILSEISRLANIMSDSPFFLPELSRDEEVLEAWWPHLLEKFNAQYGPDIENHPRFVDLRASKSKRYNPQAATDSTLRADIRVRLRQALSHIAAHRDEQGHLLQ